ncbi:MAG: N-acetylmuramoyl-L-alanine amidase [Acidobacteria bacterium]|nr:N-acetylmuramoyl-L-alanine amidase [Acidobacteriota bacterium]
MRGQPRGQARRAATHATGWNQRSIGIELVNNGDGVDPFPPPQVDALVTLVDAIRRRHPGIDASRVLRHSDVDHSTFPVASFGQGCSAFRRKEDPGEAFPWDAFRAALTAGAAPPPG